MDIKEFREKGYLQELNRQFLHPLGLALEVVIDSNGNESIGSIWDYRDDPEGFLYKFKERDSSQLEIAREKAMYIISEFEKRRQYRLDTLGFMIEPV